MEVLGILEEKIRGLVAQIKELRAENVKLVEAKRELEEKLEALEGSILKDSKNLEDLNQEKALTKMAVDDLIKSIDVLGGSEDQSL